MNTQLGEELPPESCYAVNTKRIFNGQTGFQMIREKENAMGNRTVSLETMESRLKVSKKILVFLILAFALSSITYYVMITTGTAHKIGALWMWSPGVAAILTKLLYRESLQDFGWKPGEPKYLVLGLGIPFLYALIIYGLVWVTGLGDFSPQPLIQIALFGTAGLFFACLAALGEEIGWRGLLIPELIKITSFTKATIFTGIIWVIWHYPAIIFADYNRPTPLLFQIIVFTTAVIGYSVITAWLRLKSGSLWPVVLWHAGHNLFIQQIFMMMTKDTGVTYYFVDDFGIGILIASIIMGIVFWNKRSDLPVIGTIND